MCAMGFLLCLSAASKRPARNFTTISSVEKISRRSTALGRTHTASRELVLRTLELEGVLTVAQIATQTGLHENTVRGHLASLQSDGHVRQEQPGPANSQAVSQTGSQTGPTPARRGRPTIHWRAVPPESLSPYAGLAVTLARALSDAHPDARQIAHDAGVAWGATLAADHPGPARSPIDAHAQVVQIMREQGFAPAEQDAGSSDSPIVLRRCPLIAAASERSDVVCAVHEGMLTGILASQDSGSATSGESTSTGDTSTTLRPRLLPFADGGNCVLRFEQTDKHTRTEARG